MGVRVMLGVGGIVLALGLALPLSGILASSEPSESPAAAQVDPGPPEGRGPIRHAEAIAAHFAVDPADVLALKERGVGWGAMVKLFGIAQVRGVSVESLLEGVPLVDGEYEFDFETMTDGLTEAQRQELAAMPRGLGQLGRAAGDWLPPGLAKKRGG